MNARKLLIAALGLTLALGGASATLAQTPVAPAPAVAGVASPIAAKPGPVAEHRMSRHERRLARREHRLARHERRLARHEHRLAMRRAALAAHAHRVG